MSGSNAAGNTNVLHQEQHQDTMDYLQKQLKEVSTLDQPNNQNFRIIQQYRATPLQFKVPLGSHGFLISYKKNQCTSSLLRVLLLIIISIVLTFPLFYYSQISSTFRAYVLGLLYSIPLLYLALFFLDPGTAFEDEQETFSEQRIYCITCKIYRNLSTKHCSFCNKCCQKYDHHCSVFGKCIGKRNLVLFYLFLVNICLTFALYFIATIGQLYGQFNENNQNTTQT